MESESQIIENVKRASLSNYRDNGTCVLGMHLRYDGRKIADQLWQGNMSNYSYFNDVKYALIDRLNYDESKFYIEEGHMD